MKILLINNNPLVSRMLALCTRDEDIVLDEVKSVDGIGEERYDLLFVDDSSYVGQIDTLLEEGGIRQKVFISYSADAAKGFDETIKKPFLPSQIIKVIKSVELTQMQDTSLKKHSISPLSIESESEDQIELPDLFPLPADKDEMLEEEIEEKIQEEEELELQKEDGIEEWKLTLEEEDNTEVLDSNEIEKIKALLDMDEEMIDALSVKDKEKTVDKRKKKQKEKKKKSEKKKKKVSKFSKDELGSIEKAVAFALESLDPKKLKKLLKGKEIELNIKLEDND